MNNDGINIFNIHPSKDIKSTLGKELLNKKIVICVTASVACYKSIDLIRLLIRHGAEVFVVMSKTVEKFISKDYFVWATGNNVVSRLSGNLEHVVLADYSTSDLIIVYPSTANTIGKFANGIDDTPPTSILSVALGSKIPIVIASAMHESMYENDIIKENITKLEKKGVIFLSPKIEEGKAKIADINSVLKLSIYLLNKNHNIVSKDIVFVKKSADTIFNIKESLLKDFFKNKKILISLGSTMEYIDPIRIISNTSSGKMGICLLNNALNFGSNVTVVKGITSFDILRCVSNSGLSYKILDVSTSQQMYDVIIKEVGSLSYDIIILVAAVSDFKPTNYSDSKIPSDCQSLTLTFVPTVKIVDKIKTIDKKLYLVSFKADYDVSVNTLLTKSYKNLLESNSDLVVANDVGKKDVHIGSDLNEVYLLTREKSYYHIPVQDKYQIAFNIFKTIYFRMNNKMEF